ncbi:MAG: hypothetical protein Q9174_001295 [Haloplaca sp. 1 TL-2023]
MVASLFWAQQSHPSETAQQQPPQASKATMSQRSNKPSLTPSFCFNETALRADFLRLSRSTIDDSIVQNLNALVTPARAGFDPSSTSARQIEPTRRKPIDSDACQGFKDNVLLPSWQTRSDVLNYCAGVALDPQDPDLLLREAESAKERERVVNERLDPYSGRFFPREARTESLGNLVRNERGVEGIIRARTWGLVMERCGDVGIGWEEALNRWRETKEGS